jgi:hypothetical protein
VQYEEVQRRFGAGEKLLAISGSMGLARGTVRRYAYAQSFPERAARVPELSLLDPYLGHLEARLAEGCENASVLWRDLKELGFAGSAKPVRRWLNERRTGPAKTTPHKWRSDQSGTASDAVHDPALALILLWHQPDRISAIELGSRERVTAGTAWQTASEGDDHSASLCGDRRGDVAFRT